MEPLRKFMRHLADRGCHARLDNDRLVVSGIPSWAVLTQIEAVLPELMLVGLVHNLFGRIAKPLATSETDAIVQRNRCRFCLEYRQYRCRAHKKGIPAETMSAGCARFKFNSAVYF